MAGARRKKQPKSQRGSRVKAVGPSVYLKKNKLHFKSIIIQRKHCQGKEVEGIQPGG